jgi:hypothetical protein
MGLLRDKVGAKTVIAVDSGFAEETVEFLARRADEGALRRGFLTAPRFTYDHDLGIGRARGAVEEVALCHATLSLHVTTLPNTLARAVL